jgi:enoyl-CoA hydratase/carnithine racemase
MGLANKVVPADKLQEEAREYALKLISTSSPWSMRMMKSQLYADMMDNVVASYDRAVDLADGSVVRPDFKEGLNALAERRTPVFTPLDADLAYIEWPGPR